MKNTIDQITKAEISFEANFVDKPTGGVWIGLPEPIKDLLETSDGCLSSITDYLTQDEKYRVTIKIELIA